MKPITCVLIVLVLCQLCMTTSAVKLFSEDNMIKMKDTAKELGSKMKDKAKEFVKKVKDIEAQKRFIEETGGLS
uniref:Uncharacterized protein n=1 Tax=Magallana gigas TaxID=29159 RepID=K1QA21_MAGGI